MLEKIIDYLKLKERHIKVDPADKSVEAEFRRVLNTLRENKVMVKSEPDGIYIRMAGNINMGECFSTEWAKVKSIEKNETSNN